MTHNVFVFGTLKNGFPLHDQGMAGCVFRGLCRTVQRYPMLVAGPRFAPMMLNEPGFGLQVQGELYAVSRLALATLDEIESIGKPGHFRLLIEVEPLDGGRSIPAYVYMKDRRLAQPAHSKLIDDYQDQRFSGPECG
jgi:gamma-glutamylaminecyclotransferase